MILANGRTINSTLYNTIHHHLNCNTYTCNTTMQTMSTTSHTAANIFDTFTPHRIGMVLQLYRASPSRSSISFTTSRTRDMMKANPAYTTASLNNLDMTSKCCTR